MKIWNVFKIKKTNELNYCDHYFPLYKKTTETRIKRNNEVLYASKKIKETRIHWKGERNKVRF